MKTSPQINLSVADKPFANAMGTYTLFILPFAYDLQEFEAKDASQSVRVNDTYKKNENDDPVKQGSYFTKIDKHSLEWRSRKNYLTPETSRVLHERAQWYELIQVKQPINLYRKLVTGIFPIAVLPPKLILFEFDLKSSDYSTFKTGFLIIEARICKDEKKANSHPTFDDLLKFNELFRYVSSPFNKHYKLHYKEFIAPEHANKETSSVADAYSKPWVSFLNYPLFLNNNLKRITAPLDIYECSSVSQKYKNPIEAGAVIYKDYRAFVWTCALIEKGADNENFIPSNKENKDKITFNSGFWIKLLNVDHPTKDTWNASPFEQAWADSRTYKRWMNAGTLYGFNNTTGAMVAHPMHEPPIGRHFKENYFDLFILLQYAKATLFRFSDKLSKITEEMLKIKGSQKEWKKVVKSFSSLRFQFAAFTNLYEFPLISNQQQAIEMYDLMRTQLDINDFFKEIQSEVNSTHEYLEMQSAADTQSIAKKIAEIGIPIAFLGTVGTLLTVNQGIDITLGIENLLTKNAGTNIMHVSGRALWLAAILSALLATILVIVGRNPAKRK